MRLKLSNFFNPNFLHDQICESFWYAFYRSCFTHDLFGRFSYVHGLPCEVKKLMPITCPAFHLQLMSSKITLSNLYINYDNLYMHQNKKKTNWILKNSMLVYRPASTLNQRNIGMLTADMLNKQVARYFQASESMISLLNQSPSYEQCQSATSYRQTM